METVLEVEHLAPPQVSCIIIFLNEERFLSEAIESVCAQTVADWELILVDDGSTDQSSAVARHFAERDLRIRYAEHPGHANRGMSASRNHGLRNARARFVAFLDGDDIWLPDKLAHQLAVFERHPSVGMVCGATVYWHGWTCEGGSDLTVLVGAVPGGTAVEQDRLIEPPRLAHALYPLGKGASPSMSGLMVRRDLARAVGGFVDHFTSLYEDQPFKTKLYLSVPVYVSSKAYDRYRQHAGSAIMAAQGSSRRDRARYEYMIWLQGHLQRSGAGDRLLRLKLHRALLRFRFPRLRAAWVGVKRRTHR